MERRNALVTGGSRGIGASICRSLAREGYFIYINYRKDFRGAEQVLFEIQKTGGNCELIQFDVADLEGTQRAMKEHKISTLDVLVNNAGYLVDNLISELSINDVESVLDINFFGAVSLFRDCREMLVAKKGTVITIGSIAGIKGRAGGSVYATSKAMLIAWTAGMVKHQNSKGIRFFCISPGPVMTDFIASTPWARDPGAKKRIPMKRFIEPGEIGEVAAFLVKNRELLKNGYNFVCDGGFLQTVGQ